MKDYGTEMDKGYERARESLSPEEYEAKKRRLDKVMRESLEKAEAENERMYREAQEAMWRTQSREASQTDRALVWAVNRLEQSDAAANFLADERKRWQKVLTVLNDLNKFPEPSGEHKDYKEGWNDAVEWVDEALEGWKR